MGLSALTGNTIGHYLVLDELGHGGMGVVYKARDTRLGRLAALKVLRPDSQGGADATRRFLREAQTASALNHPNILTIYDIGTDAGLDYIAMELVEGGTLADLDRLRSAARRARAPAGRAGGRRAGCRARRVDRAPGSEAVEHHDAGGGPGEGGRLRPGEAHRRRRVDVGDDDRALRRRRDRGHGAVHVARAGVPAAPSTREATCSAWARSCTRCSPGGCRSAATRRSARSRPSSRTRRRRSRESGQRWRRLVDRCLRKDPADRFQSAAELKAAIDDCLAPQRGAETPSIAVLPFANMSGVKEDDYLCEGLAEEIIDALTRIPGLRVIARTSAFAVGRMGLDVREAGSRLDVGTILEGSVRRAGARVRVTAQLVSTSDGSHVWSERYDRELTDVLAARGRDCAGHRGPAAGRTRRAAGEAQPQAVANAEAYTAYLEGRHYFARGTPDGAGPGDGLLRAGDVARPRLRAGLRLAGGAVLVSGLLRKRAAARGLRRQHLSRPARPRARRPTGADARPARHAAQGTRLQLARGRTRASAGDAAEPGVAARAPALRAQRPDAPRPGERSPGRDRSDASNRPAFAPRSLVGRHHGLPVPASPIAWSRKAGT